MSMNERWIFDDQRSKMEALGVWGIENGLEDIETVVQSRYARQAELVSRLGLEPGDLVVDLGSGMGYTAEVVAPLVDTVYCVDISPSFLKDEQTRLDARGVRNVEYVLTDYADFSRSFARRVNKIYSLLLFIHFNYFDLLYYLVECNRILTDGGLLYFDFNDGDRFVLHDPVDSFNHQIPIYKPNRKEWIFNCMHMGSLTMLRNIAPQVGYRVEATYLGRSAHSQVLLRKIGEAPDLEETSAPTSAATTVTDDAPQEPRRATLRDAVPESLRRSVRKVLPAPVASAVGRGLASWTIGAGEGTTRAGS